LYGIFGVLYGGDYMKILKYKKKKNGMYELELDNGVIVDTYEEVILAHDLLITKNINDIDYNSIEKDNKYYDCYYRALKLIKVSAKSRKELYLKLGSLDYENSDINGALDQLEKQGYLNDMAYANSYVNLKIMTTCYGPGKIRRELEQKGIAQSVIEKVMLQYTRQIQREKIDKIVNKQIRANHNKSNALLKRKIGNDLVMQGFYREDINSAIDNSNFSDDKLIMQKEYEKIKNRLSKKYSGQELEYKIREKMAQKGFYM